VEAVETLLKAGGANVYPQWEPRKFLTKKAEAEALVRAIINL